MTLSCANVAQCCGMLLIVAECCANVAQISINVAQILLIVAQTLLMLNIVKSCAKCC